MIVQTYGLVAASALAANAFMIPSTMSLKGDELSSSFWGQSPAFDGGITMLECTGCSWSEPGSDYKSKDEVKSSLALNFTLSHDSKVILFNDQPLFVDAYTTAPTIVSQIPEYVSLEEFKSKSYSAPVRHRHLSYAVAVSTTVEAADDSSVQLLDSRVILTALDGEKVNLDTIGLRLLKDESGNMRIMDVAILPPEESTSEFSILPIEGSMDNVQSHPHECPTDSSPAALFCQVRSYVKQRLASMRGHTKKPCSFRKHGGERGHHRSGPPRVKGGPGKFRHHFPGAEEEPEFHRHGRHGHHGQEGLHHGRHGHHHGPHAHRFCMRKVLHYVRHVLIGFVVPVVAAFVVGTLGGISLLFVFWLFMRLLGVRQHTDNLEAREEEAVDGEEEKFGLLSALEDQTITKDGELEGPPAYIEKPTQ